MVVVSAKHFYQHGIIARNVMTFDDFGHMRQSIRHFVIFARLGQLYPYEGAHMISQYFGLDDKLRTDNYSGVFQLPNSLIYACARHSAIAGYLRKGRPRVTH
jgi:hypothetical protein